MGVVVKERCAKLLVSKRSLGEAESAWKKKKGRFIPFGRDGREEETYLAELRLDQTFFPHCQRQSFFLPSVFFCAGENMGSVENLPSGSVWGCSAPPAAIWKTISTVCTGCFSKDLMVLFKTKQKKEKGEWGLLRVCSCHLNYDGGHYWGARKALSLHGTWPCFHKLARDGFFYIYFLFFVK